MKQIDIEIKGTIIALSDNRMLIDMIVSLCQFQRIDETQIGQVPLAEIIEKGGKQ